MGECLKAGITFKRAIFRHICEAADVHHTGQKADLVVNCTGLSASRLGGVEDKKMTPVRGQTVLVRSEPNIGGGSSGTDDGDDEICYVIQRAAGWSLDTFRFEIRTRQLTRLRRRLNLRRLLPEG